MRGPTSNSVDFNFDALTLGSTNESPSAQCTSCVVSPPAVGISAVASIADARCSQPNEKPSLVSRTAPEKLRRQLTRRAHADRLNTVGQMVSGLAHEINALLAAARNYARACVNYARSGRASSGEELLSLMENVATQADRACDIVNRLSRFVKYDSGSTSSIDINQLIQDVMTWMGPNACLRAAASRSIDVKLALASNLKPVVADRVQIEQVLVNLIRNAVDAMDDSATQQRCLTIRTADDRDCVRVSVTDTGCGIHPEYVSQLFDSFTTTKPTGIGLGLSITRSIVHAHGGKIWAESILGQGATFNFTLLKATTGQNHADGTDDLDY